jgi:predicted metalloprotease with PDZ domain
MEGELLWVYEGLTSYLGDVLTSRSGLRSDADAHENVAGIAATMQISRGRTWRPLVDTAVSAPFLYRGRTDGRTWRRAAADFYGEGLLLWLEADVVIRRETKGRKSLDDFCRAFYGGESGKPQVVRYTFDELVSTLDSVAPYDWRGFWKSRLESTTENAPLAGLAGAGWKLAYKEDVTPLLKIRETLTKTTDVQHSIGLLLAEDGTISDVVPGSPADKAGIGPGTKLVAVNRRRFSRDHLRREIRATKTESRPLELLVESAEFFKAFPLDYRGGERYPVLERDPAQPDLLEAILRPAVKAAAPAPAKK